VRLFYCVKNLRYKYPYGKNKTLFEKRRVSYFYARSILKKIINMLFVFTSSDEIETLISSFFKLQKCCIKMKLKN
jgi:hypothetical protein